MPVSSAIPLPQLLERLQPSTPEVLLLRLLPGRDGKTGDDVVTRSDKATNRYFQDSPRARSSFELVHGAGRDALVAARDLVKALDAMAAMPQLQGAMVALGPVRAAFAPLVDAAEAELAKLDAGKGDSLAADTAIHRVLDDQPIVAKAIRQAIATGAQGQKPTAGETGRQLASRFEAAVEKFNDEADRTGSARTLFERAGADVIAAAQDMVRALETVRDLPHVQRSTSTRDEVRKQLTALVDIVQQATQALARAQGTSDERSWDAVMKEAFAICSARAPAWDLLRRLAPDTPVLPASAPASTATGTASGTSTAAATAPLDVLEKKAEPAKPTQLDRLREKLQAAVMGYTATTIALAGSDQMPDPANDAERAAFTRDVKALLEGSEKVGEAAKRLFRENRGERWARPVDEAAVRLEKAREDFDAVGAKTGGVDKAPKRTHADRGTYFQKLATLIQSANALDALLETHKAAWKDPPKAGNTLDVGELTDPKAIRAELERRLQNVNTKLDGLEGLGSVKTMMKDLVNVLLVDKIKEASGLTPERVRLNAVFTGRPGTGKTTVARIYADFLKELGYVGGAFQEVTAKDLMGDVVGASRKKTADVLAKAKGGVLFIDEAYLIDPKRPGNLFGDEVVGEIVDFMEKNPDTVIVFGGYSKDIEQLLKANEGLPSRFQQKLEFADYDNDELSRIFSKMAAGEGLEASPEATKEAGRTAGRLRSSKDFANARTVRNLLGEAKARQSQRIARVLEEGKDVDVDVLKRITLDDLLGSEPLGAATAAAALDKLDKMVGLAEVKTKIRELVDFAEYQKLSEADGFEAEPIRLHTAFSGGPGTGKTTVARIYAEALSAAGLLPTTKVTEISGKDLIGRYVGETDKKVQDILEGAIGGVLFIDEVAGMIQEPFAKDAAKTLIKFMEEHYDSIVVVFADYEPNIERVMQLDDGLRRRVGDIVPFKDYSRSELKQILVDRAAAKKYVVSDDAIEAAVAHLDSLRDLPGFGNAGEVAKLMDNAVTRLARRVMERIRAGDSLTPEEKRTFVAADLVTDEMRSELERRRRSPRPDGLTDPTKGAPVRTQTQEPPAPVKPTARVDESANVKAGLLAFAERAAQSLDLSPEAARAQMRSGDPGSDLAQAVAKLAGVDAAEAAKTLSDEAKQIEQKAKAKTTGFICMYCGNSNPSCPYRERPDKDRFNAARSLD